MSTPMRIQRRRTKGFKLPTNTIYVGRPSRWGNPYIVRDASREAAVRACFDYEVKLEWMDQDEFEKLFRPLVGKNLACWCKLCEKHKDGKPRGVACRDCAPCHADHLLFIVASLEGER